MKKMIFLGTAILILASCNDNNKTPITTTTLQGTYWVSYNVERSRVDDIANDVVYVTNVTLELDKDSFTLITSIGNGNDDGTFDGYFFTVVTEKGSYNYDHPIIILHTENETHGTTGAVDNDQLKICRWGSVIYTFNKQYNNPRHTK
jgi:hypothetical protein